MKKRNTVWRWWAKALGEKACKDDRQSDIIAIVRTVIFTTYLVTNAFIVAGVIRHWNDHYEVPSYLLHQQTKEKNCSIL
jgi:hypothetical protein